jgi:hypothetical protein
VPRILCKCETVLSWSAIPNPIEWLLISDTEFDEAPGDKLIERHTLNLRAKRMLRCPTCHRLWIFWDGFSAEPTVYAPEDLGSQGA